VLLDDQSKPDTTRTLYEKLITADKVDLVLGPYGTAAILAAMAVAQRYQKLFVQSSLGLPDLATYEMQFAATVGGYDGEHTLAEKILDAYASTGHPVKTVAIASSKFPSSQRMAKGVETVLKARNVALPLFLEYDFGTHDFSPIAARVKDADPICCGSARWASMAICCSRRWASSPTSRGGIFIFIRRRARSRCCRRPRRHLGHQFRGRAAIHQQSDGRAVRR